MKIDKHSNMLNMLNKSNLILVVILHLIANLLTNTVISQTDNTYEDLLVMYVNEDFKNAIINL